LIEKKIDAHLVMSHLPSRGWIIEKD
jgi:hypothetical protein